MIKRVLQGVALGIIGFVLLAVWRWWTIRKHRLPAPQARTLIHNPDIDLMLSRDGDTLTIQWQHPTQTAQVYVGQALNSLNRDTPTTTVHQQQVAIVHGINPQERYKALVQFDDGTILTQIERELPLKSAPNFRDIGGYETTDGRVVRWHQVFRSSALDQLTPSDQAKLTELNIQLVCDIRTKEEHEADPDKLPADIDVVSIAPSSDDNVLLALGRLLFQKNYLETLLSDLYQRVMVKDNPQVFAEIFKRLADENNLPIVIHCAAGKDRAGITVALLLAFLGVPDEVIVADYSLSNHHYDFFKQATRKNLAQLRIIGLTESDFDYLLVADGTIIQSTLDIIRDEYGSVEGYLMRYVGLSPDILDQVRENLLI